jgi:hypothetical protein
MKINELLGALTKVRKTGPDRWVACCPAHEDRSPSLTIAVKPDTILLHCFSGCDTESILGAVGMTFSDLYPDHDRLVKPSRINPRDAIEALAFESLVIVASAGTMRQRNLTEKEMARLVQASSRIQAARDMVCER